MNAFRNEFTNIVIAPRTRIVAIIGHDEAIDRTKSPICATRYRESEPMSDIYEKMPESDRFA